MILRINNLTFQMNTRGLSAVVVGTAILAAGCTAAATTATPSVVTAVTVVTTNSIIADWVRQVGRDRVDVFALLPVGSDPHTFRPGARDVTRVADADLVFSIGLNLEGAWLVDLIKNAASSPDAVVPLGKLVEPLGLNGQDGLQGRNGPFDPHFWFDPLRVQRAVSDIAARLSLLDPMGEETYVANAESYSRELDDLHEWTLEQVAQIPPERRRLVTSHDTLGYFAQRYGFEVVGTIIPGVTTELDPSAAELAKLSDAIRAQRVPAIFTETTMSDRLARSLAEETGVRVIRALYTGSLDGPGTGADTYIAMIRTNINVIVDALK